MRGAPVVTVPQIVHPKPVVATVAFLVYFGPPPSHLSLPIQTPPTPHLQFQYTPLHYAARNGCEAACRVLIEARAKVDL